MAKDFVPPKRLSLYEAAQSLKKYQRAKAMEDIRIVPSRRMKLLQDLEELDKERRYKKIREKAAT